MSARRGVRKRICKGDTPNMQGTVPGVPANVIAIAFAGRPSVVFRVTGRWHCERASANHGGLTPPLLAVGRMSLNGARFFQHAVRVTEPRGLTPPALVLCECASAGDLRFPLHARNLTTGGSRPPLLAVYAFVYRKSRHFTGKRWRLQTGAAGVSPPWCAETRLQGRYRKHAGDRRRVGERQCNRGRRASVGSVPTDCAVPLRMRFRESRGAYAPALVSHECASAGDFRLPLHARYPTTGGLRPRDLALRECASAGDLRFPLHARYPTTGGLRPPLLAVHAFVHRESRHFAGTRSRLQTGAAGVHVPGAAE